MLMLIVMLHDIFTQVCFNFDFICVNRSLYLHATLSSKGSILSEVFERFVVVTEFYFRLIFFITVKLLNFGTPEIFAVIYLKF